ncbi:MAG: alpha/beta fold hydrolase [Candidatus Hermodarchaeia archaeon]
MYLQVLGFLMGKVVQSKETLVKANEIELCYDTFGESTDPPMLLIMGLGAQMIRWDEAFCKQLASSGFWVIRYDNRDVGKSTKFEAAGVPNAMELRLKAQQGEPLSVPYTLEDMALDAVGLLDALNIKQAHVVGVSMGGMIAQTIAIHHSERVRTLTSIMSSTGNPDLPPPQPEALMLISQTPPSNRDENIEFTVKRQQFLNGPHYLIDDAYVRQYAGRAFDRSFYPQGTARQLGAILASGSRKEALKTVQIPTLVIHGDADPLVPIEGGKDTTASIPGAKLFIIKGMGHDIPAKVAPQIIEAIQNHAV